MAKIAWHRWVTLMTLGCIKIDFNGRSDCHPLVGCLHWIYEIELRALVALNALRLLQTALVARAPISDKNAQSYYGLLL